MQKGAWDRLQGERIVKSSEMRAWEQSCFNHTTPSFFFMEQAGRAVARHAMTLWPSRPFLILAGPGNNGGDGFIAAKILQESGRRVRLCLVEKEGGYADDARLAFQQCNVQRLEVEEFTEYVKDEQPVLIDALFGIGLNRDIEGKYADIVEKANFCEMPILSVDIASGIHSDTGRVMGAAIKAHATITFGAIKPGHVLYPGRLYQGDATVIDLGFAADKLNEVSQQNIRINAPFALPPVSPMRHKYSRGYTMVLGSLDMPGAAMLAAKAARRTGAGIVAMAAPSSTRDLHLSYQPGLIFKPTENPSDFARHLQDNRLSALIIGCGWLQDPYPYVALALQRKLPVVLDGGALAGIKETLGENVVLTPHEGEFARAFPHLMKIESKLDRALMAACEKNAIILLKGGDCVIASPSGEARINVNAGPELASAGSGDVLAGILGGLLAQGMMGFEAACHAAWWHGFIGSQIGEGLIAEDLVEGLSYFR